MPRRRDSSVDGVLSDAWDILMATPWWTSPIIAAFLYCLLAYAMPVILARSQIASILIPTSRDIAAPFAAVLILLMGVAASVARGARRLRFAGVRGIESVDALTWAEFERLIGVIFHRQGYRVVQLGGDGPDGGIDLVLHGNGEKVLVQCKQWRNHRAGIKEMREFLGVLKSRNATASRGIFVCLGTFTEEARRFAEENSIELVDRERLQKMLGSAERKPVQTVEIISPEPAALPPPPVPEACQPDSEPVCPLCGRSMVLRTAHKGAHAGSEFWGCTGYPRCRGIRPK